MSITKEVIKVGGLALAEMVASEGGVVLLTLTDKRRTLFGEKNQAKAFLAKLRLPRVTHHIERLGIIEYRLGALTILVATIESDGWRVWVPYSGFNFKAQFSDLEKIAQQVKEEIEEIKKGLA